MAVRLGMRGWKTPPHRAAGYGLITVGAVIMMMAMPFFVYIALLGGLIAYVGYTLRNR